MINISVNANKFYCDNPEYRRNIAELATSVFHTRLTEPGQDASQQDVDNFMKTVHNLEQYISSAAMKLSDRFGVPVQIIHSEINECVEFLPKEDLKQSFLHRKKGMLH
jgi:hypothetical protein